MSMVQGNKSAFPDPEKGKRIDGVMNFCYKLLSALFLPFTLCVLAVTVVLDLSPIPYCCSSIEDFFCKHDFSSLINTSLVIWTFVASLLVYFMGRMEEQRFGLQIYKVILAGKTKSELVFKILLFLGEVVLLEISATWCWPITQFVVCMLQPVNVIFIFLMITQETSRSRVVETINTQTDKVLKRLSEHDASYTDLVALNRAFEKERVDWLLLESLRRADYKSHEYMDALQECISAERWIGFRDDHEVLLLVSWNLAYCMLDAGQIDTKDRTKLPHALSGILKEIASDFSYPDFFKVGILFSLLFNRECEEHNNLIIEMLNLLEKPSESIEIAAILRVLEELVNYGDENYTWFKGLLVEVEKIKRAREYRPLNKLEVGQIDSFIVLISNIKSAIESEEPQEQDKEGEIIGV